MAFAIPDGVGLDDAINCEVVNRELAPATIAVAKLTSPAGIAGSFSFSLANSGGTIESATGLGHGDTASFGSVPPGTYAVSESAVAGFSLTSATCDNTGTAIVETVPAGDLIVGEAENWVCTFVNTAAPGSITVVKDSLGADGTFGFTSDFSSDFDLTTSGGTANTGPLPVAPGTYSLSEQDAAPWVLTGASCSDGSSVGAINVGPDEHVVCTFTNEAPDPSITVTKTAGVGSVPEPGANVTFTIEIANDSVEPITIDTITDAVAGGPAFDVTALPVTTCDTLIGTVLAPQGEAGATATCTFELFVAGNANDVITDSVLVDGHDNDGNQVSDSDIAAVNVDDIDPTIDVDKTANPSSVPEPGANVTFTASVTNSSPEDVTITAATDQIGGFSPFDITTVAGPVLSTTCGDAIGTVLAPAATYSCEFVLLVDGGAGASMTRQTSHPTTTARSSMSSMSPQRSSSPSPPVWPLCRSPAQM